jgi:amino acid permease
MWEHCLSTFLIVSTCGFIAIIFPNITNAFAFAGGTFEVMIAGFFPMWLYVKVSPDKWTSWKNLSMIAICIILCSFGFLAAITSVLDTAKVIDINSYACIPA